MAYTFSPTASGMIEVYENGQRISTGTAGAAERYGYNSVPTPTAYLQEDIDKASNQGQPGYDVLGEPIEQESTVLSDANFREETQPQLQDRLDALTARGMYQDSSGTVRNSDDSYAPAPQGATPTDGGKYSFEGLTYGAAPEEDAMTSTLSDTDELLRQIKARTDPTTARIIAGIEAQYAVRKTQLADINKRQEAVLNQTLLMGGSSRYAQQSSEGLTATQERHGLMELAQLDAEEQNLIAQTQAAAETNNWNIVGELLDKVETKRKEKTAATQKLNDAIAEQNKELQRSNADFAIADLVSSGDTDLASIMKKLKAGGLKMNAKDVGDTLKLFTLNGSSEADLKTDYGLFSYFKQNNLLPSGISSLSENDQYFAWLNAQKLAASGKLGAAAGVYGGTGGGKTLTPGIGAKNAIEEQIIRDRMFIQFQPLFNKGVLSESDRKIIEEKIANYRNNGMSEGEILSIFAGFPSDVKTPYNKKLVEIITATTPTTDAHRELINKAGILLKSGQAAQAIRIVENQAIQRALEQKVINSDSFVTEDDVIYVKDKVDSIDKLLGEGWNNEVGAFSGTFSSWLSKKFGWGQAAKIRAKLGSLTSDMINKRAGSALTDTEWERLIQPNIPQFNESAKTWATKLQELTDNSLERYNAGRSVAALPSITINQLKPENRTGLYASSNEAGNGRYQSYEDLNIPSDNESYNPSIWDTIP